VAKVPVDAEKVLRCRALAADVASDVQTMIDRHTTVGVERTVARAYGVEGADAEGTPLANALVDKLHQHGSTGLGVAYFLGRALAGGAADVQEAAERLAFGDEPLLAGDADDVEALRRALAPHTAAAVLRIDGARDERVRLKGELGVGPEPLKYVIVATGNIYDDATQAKAARSRARTSSPSSARRRSRCSTTCPRGRPPRATAARSRRRRTSRSSAARSTRSPARSAATCSRRTTRAACA
jgi:beta-lysine 5,6-aminomutase alpha subunit